MPSHYLNPLRDEASKFTTANTKDDPESRNSIAGNYNDEDGDRRRPLMSKENQ